jgi:hopene-associated glycosyltransferase HpnB
MGMVLGLGLGLEILSLTIWVGLIVFWGRFWWCDQRLEERSQEAEGRRQKAEGRRQELTEIQNPKSKIQNPKSESEWPFVCAIVPARNEAEMIPQTLRSLLAQDYPGKFQIILVDDQSTDGTGNLARELAANMGQSSKLTVINAEPLPAGWTGKLWAMEQGDRHTQTLTPVPDYILFTDADIAHSSNNLSQLVSKAQRDDLDLVSLMVLLRCQSFWEKLLIPAFVFFFQKLYPFPLVNNPKSSIAAAAGGCILIRHSALSAIGGLSILRQALIDDCSLAKAIKQPTNHSAKIQNPKSKIQNLTFPSAGKIWLGLTQTTHSLRPYESLQTIWDMVARTAYTQLNYSPWLLVGALVGMTLVYLVPPMGAIAGSVFGLLTGQWAIALLGGAGWAFMSLAYSPTIRLYRISPLWALCLPAIAVLYNLMTIDSALRHWRGQGGAWKGRTY